MKTCWKILILAGVLILVGLPVPVAEAAEDVEAEFEAGHWGTEMKLGINMLQSYYTRNWNGGDKGSVVWTATLDALAKKRLSDSFTLSNTLNLAFGQNHQQERDADGSLYWQRPDKTTDEITFESLLRYTRSALDPYFSVRFESQFLDQSDPRKDFTLNPLRFSESVGISRTLVKNEDREWLARLGFTLHQSVRSLYIDGDTQSETTTDGGIELVFDYTSSYFADRVDYVGQIRAYKPLFYSNKGDIEDFGGAALLAAGLDEDLADFTTAVDLEFKNTFTTHITSALNIELMIHWVYDKYDNTVPLLVADDGTAENVEAVAASVRKKGQLKQTMSIGLAHTF